MLTISEECAQDINLRVCFLLSLFFTQSLIDMGPYYGWSLIMDFGHVICSTKEEIL